MKLVLPEEIRLDADNEVRIELPETEQIKIEDLQVEISCGFNMLNKKIRISLHGERFAELPQVTLSQMHRLLVDMRTRLPSESGWTVTHLVIRPCQKINYPITIGINTLVSAISLAFGFLCQMPEMI